MLRTYLENKQTQLLNKKIDFYTSGGIHVFFKDPIANPDVDIEKVISVVETKIPHHMLSEIEMVAVGWFEEFEERDINAFYKDAILHISNKQDNDKDMIDDIIHEIAHSVEEKYGYEIYADSLIKDEFLSKRGRLHDELWSLGYKLPKTLFADFEYSESFDSFLLNDVGYDKLSVICNGLFINAYAPTSLREYFATAFTDYYMMPDDHNTLKLVSPAVYKKLNTLNSEDFVDTYV